MSIRSAHIQQDQIVAPGSPENALSAGSLRRRPRHRDCAEHSPACRASCVFVDEQNLFAVEG